MSHNCVYSTMACTVVSCERAFSKLRFEKSRLRSLIGQELLESLYLRFRGHGMEIKIRVSPQRAKNASVKVHIYTT